MFIGTLPALISVCGTVAKPIEGRPRKPDQRFSAKKRILEPITVQVRARVERSFHVLKNVFRHRKKPYRGRLENPPSFPSSSSLPTSSGIGFRSSTPPKYGRKPNSHGEQQSPICRPSDRHSDRVGESSTPPIIFKKEPRKPPARIRGRGIQRFPHGL